MIKNLLLITCIMHAFCAGAQTDSIGSGRAIRFDGVNDYIDLGNIYDEIALPVTISAWVYVENGTTGTLPIFDSQDGSATYNGFTMISSSTPHIGVAYGDGLGGNHPIYRAAKAGFFEYLPGRWVHMTGVMEAPGNMRVYLNGYNLGGNYEGYSTNAMNSYSPNENAKIGKLTGNVGIISHFKGILDDIRIWNKALTEDEIRSQMCRKLTGTEEGLIGYWTFDEESGNTVKDLSANHYDGTLIGEPVRVTSGAPIGDESTYLYTNSWTNQSVMMSHDHEAVTVNNVTDSPYGVQIYKITSVPSHANGAEGATPPYFGVYVAADNLGSNFNIDHTIETIDSVILYSRVDNSVTSWSVTDVETTTYSKRVEIIKQLIHRGKKDQTIAWPLPTELLCAKSTFDLPALSSAGLALSYEISNSEIVTFDPETLKLNIQGAGQFEITVTQAGNSVYNSITKVYSITVLPALQSLTFELPDEVEINQSS
jgi:hypothetical protein